MYTQRNKLAYKDRYLRRSRYISKKRASAMFKVPTISKRKYGKSIVAKLAYYASADITTVVDWNGVYGLVSVMQASPDWANFRDSYALFNILNVTVKVYPNLLAYSSGVTRVAGICYDVKDSAAISTVQAICDHNQHMLINFMGCETQRVFTCKAKAVGNVPQSTGISTETWGYIKAYGSKNDLGNANITIAKLEFIITVSFSQEQ